MRDQPFHRPDQAHVLKIKDPGTRPNPLAPPPVAALVAAYNEAPRIGSVLDALSQVDEINEIIVVDDGSTDATAEVVSARAGMDHRICLIRHPLNQGKGQAVYSGWKAARATLLLTVDADLIDLTPDHIRSLIRPVAAGQADMTLGLFHGGRLLTDLSHSLTPWLTGQRCFRASLLHYVSPEAAAGYGIETALTVAARQRDYRCLKVRWPRVSHPPSEQHRGLWAGIRTRARMYAQIGRAWYLASGHQRLIDRLRQWLSFG